MLVERDYSDPYSAPVFRLEIVSKDMAPGKSSFELPLPCDGQLFVDTLRKRLEPLDATAVIKKLRPIVRKALDEYLAVIEQNA